MNREQIENYIKNQPSPVPDHYDGSYELIRETVKAYSEYDNYEDLNSHDLNAVYTMTLGTWVESVEKKKEAVLYSNLPESVKESLIDVLDRVWDGACNKKYINGPDNEKESKGRPIIGVFGNEYSSSLDTNDEDAKAFLRMLADIADLDDPEEIYSICEKVLNPGIEGLEAPEASIMLYCLKPFVFPIMTGAREKTTIFSALGVRLNHPNELRTYIANSRKINDYTRRHFGRVDYRVLDNVTNAFDLVEDITLIDEEKAKEAIKLYKENFEEFRKNELFKWESVKQFREFYDEEADNFYEMLKEALKEANKFLLSHSHFFPGNVILEIAKNKPEYARKMFQDLYDKTTPLTDRVKAFREAANIYGEIRNNEAANTYQSNKAVSIYLFLRYPDEYYIYGSSKLSEVAQYLDYTITSEFGTPDRIEDYTRLGDELCRIVSEDEELLEMSRNSLNEDCYDDPDNHLLTEDLMLFIERMSKKAVEEEPATVYNSYRKNMILYGPPGTGKTFNTVIYAVAIIENKTVDEIRREAAENYTAVKDRYDACLDKTIQFTTFHQSYSYEEFIEGIKPKLDEDEQDSKLEYKVADGVFKLFCENAENDPSNNYVFIIDEINRGNISKIFGELITLIEETKRKGEAEAAEATLPYSGKSFGVPGNVYILGTMNTADRSIALLDTALRRRFAFVEMMPDPNVLRQLHADVVTVGNAEADIAAMLSVINRRIEFLYDREHMIGHAFFTPLRKDNSIEKLAEIFRNSIIPLLQEYFYEDYEKIRMVLGDKDTVPAQNQFIRREIVSPHKLFGNDAEVEEKYTYLINNDALNNIYSYIKIYQGIDE